MLLKHLSRVELDQCENLTMVKDSFYVLNLFRKYLEFEVLILRLKATSRFITHAHLYF